MSKKLVVKRKRTGKHVVDDAKHSNTLLKAEYLTSIGEPAGIPAILLQNPKYQKRILKLKKDLEVSEVVPRTSSSNKLRSYLENDQFIASLARWWEKYHGGSFTIKRFTTSVADAQAALIIDTKNQPEKILALGAILKQYSPELLNQARKEQWWEAQIALRRKLTKK